MFIVFNKRKICSYLVSFSTVIFLFVIAFAVTSEQSIITSSTVRELPVYSVNTNNNKIALTMNCAWNADDIDNILQTLKDNNIKITFFMVGDWVDKFPEAVKKIADAGHEIGNHSNTHPHMPQLSKSQMCDELKSCNEKIEKLTGICPTLLRPPYGDYDNALIEAVESLNMKTIQWSVDIIDTKVM